MCAPPAESIISQLSAQRRNGVPMVDLLPTLFPFKLDSFQLDALAALDGGESVVVAAPTGSGKTAIAELALYLALAAGERAVYTTPLKALSNQKFDELGRKFGRANVGLLTGDTRINRAADVLVMTTEVYRNMLLDPEPEPESALSRVGVVVLDEFHYMNDASRGTVWEESCILTPAEARIVALSATMSNAKQIVEWLTHIHGETRLVETAFRPVPLRYHFADTLGVERLFSSLASGPGGSGAKRAKGWRINPALKPNVRGAELERAQLRKANGNAHGGGRGGSRGASRGGGRGGGRGRGDGGEQGAPAQGGRGRERIRSPRELARQEVATMPFVVRCLARQGMLPAIVFIFSRVGCDAAAAATAAMREPLVSDREAAELGRRVSEWRRKHADLPVDEERLERLRLGIASHHAGMLPLEKKLAENLFQANLLRVVYATETLAAGINMPARATVISTLSKRGDNGIAPLTASQLLQMAGRAGRRGLDELGHVVLCRSPYEDAAQACALLARPPDAIESRFYVSYGSALKMLRARPLPECRRFVASSFGSFVDASERSEGRRRLHDLRRRRRELSQLLAAHPPASVDGYVRLSERLKKEQRSLTYLREQVAAEAAEMVETLLGFVVVGTCALTRVGEAAVLVDDAPPGVVRRMAAEGESGLDGADSVMLVLRDGGVVCCDARQVSALFPDVQIELGAELVQAVRNALPDADGWKRRKDGSYAVGGVGASDASAAVGALIPTSLRAEEAPQVLKQESRVQWAIEQLRAHPLHSEEARDALLRAGEQEAALAAEEAALARRLGVATTQEPQKRRGGDGSRGAGVLADLLAGVPPFDDGAQPVGETLDITPRVNGQGDAGTDDELDGVDDLVGEVEDGEVAWAQFMSVGNLLQEYGALEDWKPTEFGELVAELSGDNELWLALVLMEVTAAGGMSPLSPAQLAAVLAATLDERVRPNAYIGFFASEEVLQTLSGLNAKAESLQDAQWRHGLGFSVSLEAGLCGLVEAWARGVEWPELVSETSLDSGDLYRLLRRTLELLKQVLLVPYVSEQARRNARIAVRALDRYPISDGGLMAVGGDANGEDEDEDEPAAATAAVDAN